MTLTARHTNLDRAGQDVLVVDGLVRRFGDLTAVDGVSFRIAPGETYGLLGPNGAGKTTTISMIAGLIAADEGTVTVLGEAMGPSKVAPKRNLGLVPQELAIYPDLSARENLNFFGKLQGLTGAGLKARVAEVLELTGLTDRAKGPTKEFSGGMKRRLNIGIGLLHKPTLLILDEPTVGVDPQSRNQILESVESLSGEGMAVLYTTHYMEEAERLCDRIGIIDSGTLQAEGTRDELIKLTGGVDNIQLSGSGDTNAAAEALVAQGYKGKLGPMAHNTLVHRIAVMSKAHQLRQLDNPCQDAKVRELLSRTRKAYAKRGALPRKKSALTKDPLQAVLATCDESLRGKRDRALLLFAWASGGRRRSEVAAADMQYLRRIAPAEFVYTLAHSKTNQSGRDRPENHKPVLGAAGSALQDWLQTSGIVQGRIFLRVLKGGHLGGPMSPAAVRTIVQERCALAGIEGDFSAHSLRSGFVTEAGRQDVSLADTMALTGHLSIPTVMGYYRAESTVLNRGARLLDEQTPDVRNQRD